MQTKEEAISHLKSCGEGYEKVNLQEDESGVLCGTHENGLPVRIAGSNEFGWFEVHGGICDEWLRHGGPNSILGLPISNEEDDPNYRDPNGKRSRFQHGTIHGWPRDPGQPKGAWTFATEMDSVNPYALKTREEVITLFRAKYDYLKSVYPSVGSFDEACAASLYQNPDGGWQLNLSPCAAITLRPGDSEAHETHGTICAKWYDEGGAFKGGIPGWLGYPISDEERKTVSLTASVEGDTFGVYPPSLSVSAPVSEFEFGTIEYHDEQSVEEYFNKCKELWPFSCDFYLGTGTYAYLNETGRKHVPPDIEDAIKDIISFRNIHPINEMTSTQYYYGGKWEFHLATEDFSSMDITLWRDGTNIRVKIDAIPKPKPKPGGILSKIFSTQLENQETIHEEFSVPNRKAMGQSAL